MDVSIIEIVVYGIICYAGMLGLIVSAFKETPTTKSQSATRVIWLMPSIFCAYMLASAGADIYLTDETITSTTINLNSTEVWQETITQSNKITLLQPVWVTLHFLFFIVMLIYVLFNILSAFFKRE